MSSKKPFAFSWQGYQHKVPLFIENKSQQWVSYGVENDYPNYLLNLYRRSAKHNAIVNGKVGYIVGKGWTSENETPAAKAFLDSPTFPNAYDSMNDLTQKLTLDMEIYNGFALEVTWSRGGGIAEICHVDFHRVRADKDEKMFYVYDWYDEYEVRQFPQLNQVNQIPAFDPDNRIGKQLFYYRAYSAGVKVYPLPEYLGGTAYIELDVEIANFHVNNIKNNFWGSYLINFPNGIPTPEESDAIERQMKMKFGGTDNAGRFLVNFSDSPETKPELTPLTPSDLDKQFDILNKTVQQEIFVAHRVTSPMLFGVKTEGQLGGRAEMVESYEIFKATYIEDRVQRIERSVNYLASFNGVTGLKLQPTEPISEQLTEAALLQILTRDELREKAGYEPELLKPNEAVAPQEMGNSVLAGLSASQQDKMLRVVRKYSKGDLTKEQATIMLQGFGLPAEQVDLFLGEPMEFNSDEDKFEQVAMQFGVDADGYQVLRSKPVRFEADNSVMAEFMEVEPENKELDKKILAEIKRTKKVDADQISRRLDVPLEKVSERIEYLISKGKVTIENRIARIADTPDTAAEEAFEIRYKYDWRPEFKSNAASLETGSREFCKTLLRLNKLYTRQDIDQMTAIMGYSVWDRRGEWYTLPGTNISRPSCRHIWQQQIVVRKGNKIELV
jgi:DNA-binding Lrp family transcriptional regulator